jgi:hypothetical protein
VTRCLYRIKHASHHNTGDRWCVYPMYDFAHGLSDYIEGITHSICTLEFVPHRPLYDWLLEALDLPRPLPHQYEFARLDMTHTLMSKRKLLRLVKEGHVRGWDDPRMPTLSAMRPAWLPGGRACATSPSASGGAAREPRRAGAARALRARGPQPHAAAAHGGAASAQGGDRELSRGAVESFDAANNPEDPAAGTRACRSGASCGSSRTTSARCRPQVLPSQPGVEVRLRGAT